MRSSGLHQAPFLLVLVSLFCGVAALREVEDTELATVSPGPDAVPAEIPPQPGPPCGEIVPGSIPKQDERGQQYCACNFPDMATDPQELFCKDLGDAWSPDNPNDKGCQCRPPPCALRVYEAIFGPFSEAAAEFPKPLPGLDGKDLLALVHANPENPARKRMGAVQSNGIAEASAWTVPRGERLSPVVLIKDIDFTENTEVWALGDLHGRLGSLRQVNRQWRDANMEPYIVGLGDMVDRGNRQLEVVAGMIAWRTLFPHKVSFTRGNHETRAICTRDGFGCVGTDRPYPTRGLRDAYIAFFDTFPAALRIGQPNPKATAVYMHGGFGPSVMETLHNDGALREHRFGREELEDDGILNELLWSEGATRCVDRRNPSSCKSFREHGERFLEKGKQVYIREMFKGSDRGAGYYFSTTAMRMFMKLTQSCMLITGHSHTSGQSAIALDPLIETAEGRCGREGYRQAITLSAYNFYRHSDLPPDDEDYNIGYKGVLSFGSGDTVTFYHVPIFSHEEYASDSVSQMLDVGVGGGAYPTTASGCAYLVPDGPFRPDKPNPFRCFAGQRCPDPLLFRPPS